MLFERVDKGSTTRKGIIGLAIGAVATAVVAAVAYSKSNAEVSGNELINAAELINTAAIQAYHVNKHFIGDWRTHDEYLVLDIPKMKANQPVERTTDLRIYIRDGAYWVAQIQQGGENQMEEMASGILRWKDEPT